MRWWLVILWAVLIPIQVYSLPCRFLFEELLSEVHMPFSRLLDLDSSRADQRPLDEQYIQQLRSMYNIHSVQLLPQSAFDQITAACHRITSYFEELIDGYPQETQQMLRKLYYERENVFKVRGWIEKQGTVANWYVTKKMDPPRVVWLVDIDADVFNTPILYHMAMIHEVAVHVGQAHQRLSQIGFDSFVENKHLSTFNDYSELPGAMIDKKLVSAIPFEFVIVDALRHFEITRMGAEQAVNFVLNENRELRERTFRKHMDFKIRHRKLKLTADEIARFEEHYALLGQE